MTHEFWYLSRAAGFTAYLLLFVSVALGIAIGARLTDPIAKRASVFDLHRFTTLLALAFTLFHVYVMLGDGYFNLNVWQLSVPFLSPYRTWATAVGVASLYVMVLVIGSFYVRRHIGYKTWRALHFLTFALYAGAILHGITSGTDTTQAWARFIYVTTGMAIVLLILYRAQYRVPDNSTVRTLRLASGAATVVTAVVLVFGTNLLQGARQAEGENALTAAAEGRGGAATAAPSTQGPYPLLASFNSDFTGTYKQAQDATQTSLTLDGTTAGDFVEKLHIELVQALGSRDNEQQESPSQQAQEGPESQEASVVVNKAQVLDTSSDAVLCDGHLTTLDENYLRLTCEGAGPYQGVSMTMATRLQASQDGSFSGPLSGSMERRG